MKSQEKEIDIRIGSLVKEVRIYKSWSRKCLAEKIGVTHQQVMKYENGKDRISASKLLMIAKALGRPITFFYSIDLIENSNRKKIIADIYDQLKRTNNISDLYLILLVANSTDKR